MKDYLKYFIWAVIIGIILFIGETIRIKLSELVETTYRVFPLVVYDVLFPIFIGMFLRLPRLIQEIREHKQWAMNWTKLLAIGLPALYMILTQLFLYTSNGIYFPFASEIAQITSQSTTTMTIVSLVFGYILLDSLKK
ncbi:hypothetical protein V7157_17350 [Neobacillus drentensis]|uniref:hypothetical protein n=1 Tax=Neobacillus drentensis TaxID=220684 RepID=UPI003002ACD6